jgi:hypothetical protein
MHRSNIQPKAATRKKKIVQLKTHFLFLDYEKAFDQVNRLKLFNMLQKRNIPDPLFTAIFKIYEHNEISIKLNSKLSKSLAVNRGVRQGCPLSPTLFNIYIYIYIYK